MAETSAGHYWAEPLGSVWLEASSYLFPNSPCQYPPAEAPLPSFRRVRRRCWRHCFGPVLPSQFCRNFAGVFALGVAAAAEDLPRRPSRISIGLPHSSQSMSVAIGPTLPFRWRPVRFHPYLQRHFRGLRPAFLERGNQRFGNLQNLRRLVWQPAASPGTWGTRCNPGTGRACCRAGSSDCPHFSHLIRRDDLRLRRQSLAVFIQIDDGFARWLAIGVFSPNIRCNPENSPTGLCA